MSAYTERQPPSDQELEAAWSTSRQAETALAQNRQAIKNAGEKIRALSYQAEQATGRISALEKNIAQSHFRYDRLRAAAQDKVNEFYKREELFRTAIQCHQTKQQELESRLATQQEISERLQNEITLYKNSWTQVLQAERDAQSILKQKEILQNQIEVLRAQIKELRPPIMQTTVSCESSTLGQPAESLRPPKIQSNA